MIDAVKFATTFTAFWNTTTPTCEHFTRKLNLRLYEREQAPLINTGTVNRAFIAEFAFSLFVERRWPSSEFSTPADIETAAREAAIARLAPLEKRHEVNVVLSNEEMSEVREIAKRLRDFFVRGNLAAVPRPIFRGCGFIDASEGDVILGPALYEVKTVDRGFRGNDIRQLVTYSALNSLGNSFNIERIGLYNPRRGVSFEANLDYVSREISGKSSRDLFEDIFQAISGGGISR